MGGGGTAQRDDQDPGHDGRPSGHHPLHRGRDQRERHPALLGRALRGGDRGLARRHGAAPGAGRVAGDGGLGGELLREPGGRQGGPPARTRHRSAVGSPSPTRPPRTGCSSGPSARRAGTGWRRRARGPSGRSGPRPAPRIRGTPTPTTSKRWSLPAPSTPFLPRPSPPTATMAAPPSGSARASRHPPPTCRGWPSGGSISRRSPGSWRRTGWRSSRLRTARCWPGSRPRRASSWGAERRSCGASCAGSR